MKRIPLPGPDNITAEWLHKALIAGGTSDFPEIESLEIERLSDVVSAMGHLFRCRVITRGGVAVDPVSVIVKLPTSNAVPLKLAKWLSLYRREYVYYRDLSPHTQVRVPTLFYGDLDARSHRFALVLEDLGDMQSIPQSVGVGVDRGRRAIREIAGFQGRFWEVGEDPALAACGAFLTAGQRRIMQTLYLLTLPLALERFADLFTTDTRRQAEAFGSKIDAHFAAVAEGPKTVVHGDYRSDNVLFGNEGEDDFAVIDWQGCGIGCGLYDVAFFLATSVSIDDRRHIERDAVAEYHDIVCRMGAENYSHDECWRSYRQNMLGSLMPMVLGCGAIDVNDEALRSQTRALLERTLTALDDLNSWEFLPAGDGLFSSSGAFSTLSRYIYRVYRSVLGLRKRKGD